MQRLSLRHARRKSPRRFVPGLESARGLESRLVMATINGTTFNDINANGTQDAGERITTGVTVFLDNNDNGTLDGNGTVNSSDVPKTISSGAPPIQVTSTLSVGTTGTISDLNVFLRINHTYDSDLDIYLIAPDATRRELFTDVGGSGANFGTGTGGSIVYTTLDDEATTAIGSGTAPFAGSYKPEVVLSGFDGKAVNGTWTLEINDDANIDGGSLIAWGISYALTGAETFTTTNASGQYSFTGLSAGNYIVASVPPIGRSTVFPTGDGKHRPTLGASDTFVANFGHRLPPGLLAGNVFEDLDADGIIDAGELPLVGVGVSLDVNNDGSPDANVLTDSLGDYFFATVPAGTHKLTLIPPSGYSQTYPVSNGAHIVALAANQGVPGLNFGARQTPGSISGTAYADADLDGVRDGGEGGLSGVTIFLDQDLDGTYDVGEPTQTTDSGGNYTFADLPPNQNYRVGAVTPASHVRTGPTGLTPSTTPNKNANKQVGDQSETHVAIDPNNIDRIFTSANNLGTAVGMTAAVSGNGGSTYAVRNWATGSDIASGFCDPTGQFDRFGNLWMAYLAPSPIDILVARSTDGGATFTNFANLGGDDQPTLVVGPSSTPGRDLVAVCFNQAGSIRVSYLEVDASGPIGSFTTPVLVPGSDTSISGNFGDIVVGPNGQVAVTYQHGGSGNGPDSVYFNLDPDGIGSTAFGSRSVATTTNVGGFDFIPAQPDRSVDAESGLAYDRSGGPNHGRLYMVYTNEVTNESHDMNIYVRYSNNDGSTWSSPIQVNDDITTRSQFLPRISVDQSNGAVIVSFYDARDDSANVRAHYYLAISTDGGLTYSPNVRLSQGSSSAVGGDPNDYGDYSGLSAAGGRIAAAWADNSNSTGDNPNSTSALDMYVAIASLVPGFHFMRVAPGQSVTGRDFGFDPPAPPPGDLIVSVNGAGNLVVVPSTGGTIAETVTLQSDTANSRFVLSEPTKTFTTTIAGATGNGTTTLTIPFSAVTGLWLDVALGAGDDKLIVDYSLGNFPEAIVYDGGAGIDGIRYQGGGTVAMIYHVLQTADYGWAHVDYADSVSYDNIENVVEDALIATNREFSTSPATDTVTISDPTTSSAGTMRLTASTAATIDFAVSAATTEIALLFPNSATPDTLAIPSVDPAFTGKFRGVSSFKIAAMVLNRELEVEAVGDVTQTGVISGTSPLRLDGPGTLKLTLTNTYSGITYVQAGNLIVNGTQSNTNVTMTGGSIGGRGKVKSLTATGGQVQPGDPATANGAGNFTVNNATSLTNSSLVLQVNGTGTNTDKLTTKGLTLSNTTLSLSALATYVPALGIKFIIVNNTATTPVSGTFVGLPEGATVSAGIWDFQISYVGGTGGNDVTITRLAENVTSQVSIARGALTYSASTNKYSQVLTITNTSGAPIRAAGWHITLDSLVGGTLANGSGFFGASPYRKVTTPTLLNNGASFNVTLSFTATSGPPITYTERIII